MEKYHYVIYGYDKNGEYLKTLANGFYSPDSREFDSLVNCEFDNGKSEIAKLFYIDSLTNEYTLVYAWGNYAY